MNVRPAVATLLVVALAGLAASAFASSPPTAAPAQSVVIVPPVCKFEAFALIPFLDSLRVELAGTGLGCCTLADAGDQLPADGSLRVRIEIVPCVVDAESVQVSVQAAADAPASERDVSLADVISSARPRALALAVAELVRSLEQGARKPLPETIAAPAKVPVLAPPPAANPRQSELEAVLEGEARAYPSRDTLMGGGRLRLTAIRGHLHADLDGGADFARAGSGLGNVLVRSATAGLTLGPRLETRLAIVDVGLRAELGWAWIRGEAASANVHTGAGSDLISSLGLRVSLAVPARLKLRPILTLESGAVLRGFEGEVSRQPQAGMTGYYFMAGFGIGAVL
jgi:hypothetical protein